MARVELNDSNVAVRGEGPVGAGSLFDLGLMYSAGRSVPVDYIAAHKCFNLAAMQGNREAARLRQEVAEQMSDEEIAAAQRAARAWLKAH